MLLELHLIYVILKIEMPCYICSSHPFFQGGGQPVQQYVASGVIGFVVVHCLWNGEVRYLSRVFEHQDDSK